MVILQMEKLSPGRERELLPEVTIESVMKVGSSR